MSAPLAADWSDGTLLAAPAPAALRGFGLLQPASRLAPITATQRMTVLCMVDTPENKSALAPAAF
jgi:hypothetical protein